MKKNKAIEQMAKNMLNCSKRSLAEVLKSLEDEDRELLVLKMSEFRSKSSAKPG